MKQTIATRNLWIHATLLVTTVAAAVAVAGYLWLLNRELLIDNVRVILLSLAPLPLILVATRLWPARPRQKLFSAGLMQDAVYYFVMGGFQVVVIAWLIAALFGLCDDVIPGLRIEAVSAWTPASRIVLAVIAADFLNWLHHFVRHKVSAFWKFHAVHHSQQEMNALTDLRNHFMEYIIAKLIILLPAYALQLEAVTAFGIALVIRWHTMAYHANIRSNYGWLRYVLVTPQSHRIHHSHRFEHRDKNFGVVFSIWDRMFGTQHPDCTSYPETGIEDERFPLEQDEPWVAVITNFVRQTFYPFQQLFVRRDKRSRIEPGGPTETLPAEPSYKRAA